MLHRRSTATALVAVLLPVAAALSSCGFDNPTDRVNTIGAGVNDRDASVDVLGARVVSNAEGAGRLIGTLANNDNDASEPTALESVEGADVSVDLPAIEVAGNASVNLADDEQADPVAVSGDFAAGDLVTLTYSFSTGESVTLDVPVVKACGQYEGITLPDGASTPSDESTEHTDAGGSHESDGTYLCEHETHPAEGGH